MKWLVLALIVLLCLVPVKASIDAIKISTAIEQNIAYLDYVVLVSGPEVSIVLPIPFGSQIVYAKDSYGNLKTEIIGDSANISIPVQIEQGEQRALTLKIKSLDMISQKSSYDEFTWNVYLDEPTNFEQILLLPEKTQKVLSVEPDASSEQTMNRKAVRWTFSKYSGGVFLVQYVPEKSSEFTEIIALCILGAIIIVPTYYFVLRKKRKTEPEKNVSNSHKKAMLEKIDVLNIKEKQVMQEIIENGTIAQYEIKAKLNLTKSNLSKVVKNLEMKGLLKRERIGKINKLVPGERFKEQK